MCRLATLAGLGFKPVLAHHLGWPPSWQTAKDLMFEMSLEPLVGTWDFSWDEHM